MHCVNNLWINTTWLVAERPMEMHINGSWWEVVELSACNMDKQISFGLGRDENLPDFGPEDSNWIGLNEQEAENGLMLDIGWTLPYNLLFSTKDERDTFISALEAKVHSLCSYRVIEGDLSIEESIGYVLEKDANQAYNKGRKVKHNLIKPFTYREYQVFRWERNGIKVLEIWK